MSVGNIITPKCGGPPYFYDELGRITIADGNEVLMAKSWPDKVDQWRDLIARAAAETGLPEAWIAGVMCQESGGNPKACSPCQKTCCSEKGCCAHGLMQITWGLVGTLKITDVWDPEQNVFGGARWFRKLADKHDWDIAACAASYNAGGVYCKETDTSRWHVRQNAGYVDGVIRFTNYAITHKGYSGLVTDPAGPSEVKEEGLGVFAKGALVLSAIVIAVSGVYFVNTKSDWRSELPDWS